MTEAEIRPPDLMARKAKLVDEDRTFLLQNKKDWHLVKCPACKCDPFSYFGEKQGFTYVSCNSCGMIYTNPRPSLDLLTRFYANSRNYAFWNEHIFPASENVRMEKIFRPRAQLLTDYCSKFNVPFGTALEIGAAFGTFCQALKERNYFSKVIALEPTPGLAETCRQRGFETLETTIEQLKHESFADIVTAFEVIEHIHDPYDFVRLCRKILKPNGLLVLSCPNVRGFDALVLNISSSMFDHEHINYFSPLTIKLLLEGNEFEVLEVGTPGKLDVDLVRNYVNNCESNDLLDPFLKEVVFGDNELRAAFQTFITANGLSSHMWTVARSKC